MASSEFFEVSGGSQATNEATGQQNASQRCGKLLQEIETPCYIPASVCGNLAHLTPDNCDKLKDFKAQVVALADIISSVELVKANQLDFQEFLNIHKRKNVLSAMDFVEGQNPSNSKAGFSILTSMGRCVITVDDFMETANLLKPACTFALADEIQCSSGKNRQRAAVDLSLDWLDKCLEKKSVENGSMMCGVVLGGTVERLRRISVQETCKRAIDGVVISQLDSCDDLTLRHKTLDWVVPEIPDQLPRFLTGLGDPLEVLECTRRGIDAFVSSYPLHVANDSKALTFWVHNDDETQSDGKKTNPRTLLNSVDMTSDRYRKDPQPLLPGCECFACKNHSRAYIHHLVHVKEMLGSVLLYLHNLHHYYRFFAQIRQQIADQSFDEYKKTFEEHLETRSQHQ